jgi:hypothetical protein
MTQVLNPHLRPQLLVAQIGSEGGSFSGKPVRIPVPKEDSPLVFPQELIDAVGESFLKSCPIKIVEERATGYFDGCIKMDMFGEGTEPGTGISALKGRDQYGRVFFSFLIHNDNFKEIKSEFSEIPERCAIFTIFQRYEGLDQYNNRWCYSAPTNDTNFISSCVMNESKWKSVKQVFDGTHADLKLGR